MTGYSRNFIKIEQSLRKQGPEQISTRNKKLFFWLRTQFIFTHLF